MKMILENDKNGMNLGLKICDDMWTIIWVVY